MAKKGKTDPAQMAALRQTMAEQQKARAAKRAAEIQALGSKHKRAKTQNRRRSLGTSRPQVESFSGETLQSVRRRRLSVSRISTRGSTIAATVSPGAESPNTPDARQKRLAAISSELGSTRLAARSLPRRRAYEDYSDEEEDYAGPGEFHTSLREWRARRSAARVREQQEQLARSAKQYATSRAAKESVDIEEDNTDLEEVGGATDGEGGDIETDGEEGYGTTEGEAEISSDAVESEPEESEADSRAEESGAGDSGADEGEVDDVNAAPVVATQEEDDAAAKCSSEEAVEDTDKAELPLEAPIEEESDIDYPDSDMGDSIIGAASGDELDDGPGELDEGSGEEQPDCEPSQQAEPLSAGAITKGTTTDLQGQLEFICAAAVVAGGLGLYAYSQLSGN